MPGPTPSSIRARFTRGAVIRAYRYVEGVCPCGALHQNLAICDLCAIDAAIAGEHAPSCTCARCTRRADLSVALDSAHGVVFEPGIDSLPEVRQYAAELAAQAEVA